MKKFILVAVLSFFASTVHSYRLNSVAESGARWSSYPVTMTLNPYNSGISAAETQRAIDNAMASWNGGIDVDIFQIGSIDRSLSSSEGMNPDAVNAMVFSTNFTADTGFDVDTTVAVGGQYGDGSVMSSGFIIFNAQKVGWGTDSERCPAKYSYCDDIETIALHELGHVLGLGHSEQKNAVMSASRTYKVTRTLAQDDIDGGKYLVIYSGAAGGSAGYNSEDSSSGGSGGGCGTITGNNSGNGSSSGTGASLAMMLLPLLALGVLRNRIALQFNR